MTVNKTFKERTKAERSNIHRTPYSYYFLPVSMQVVFKRVRQSVDAFCRVDCTRKKITYTLKGAPYTILTLTVEDCDRIYKELYCE